MNINKQIQVVRAITAAGFLLSNNKTFRTPAGDSWAASLSYGSTKLVTVQRSSTERELRCEFVVQRNVSRRAQQDLLDQFWSMPSIVEMMLDRKRKALDQLEAFPCISQTEYSQRKDETSEDFTLFSMKNLADIIYEYSIISAAVKVHRRRDF